MWYKNGRRLALDDSPRFSMTSSPFGVQVIEVVNTTSALQISDLVLSDRGNYSCFSSNFLTSVRTLESEQLDFIVFCKSIREAL